jgi:hypothetical protein
MILADHHAPFNPPPDFPLAWACALATLIVIAIPLAVLLIVCLGGRK